MYAERADITGDHFADVDADAESGLDAVTLGPAMRERPRTCSSINLAARIGALGAVLLRDWHAEADQQAVARHAEHGAFVFERDVGQQLEELVQQLDDLLRIRSAPTAP